MAELFLIGMIVTLVVLTIRSGRPVILDTPVIIHRLAQYHITLAPQLNRAQGFIEKIAEQLRQQTPALLSSDSVFFSVNDAKLCPTGEQIYLLAVSVRGGIYYFQAIMPQPLLHDRDSHYQTIRDFSSAVLIEQPMPNMADDTATLAIAEQVIQVAARTKTPIVKLKHTF